MKKLKHFGKWLLTVIITVLYLVTFGCLGIVFYYLSKVFKIIGHTFLLEFATAKEELRTFWNHYTNLGDI